MEFKNQVIVSYPIPMEASIYGSVGVVNPLYSMDSIIESCVPDVSSDIAITCYEEATGMTIQLPEDTIAVLSAKLSFQFQGNRFVKVNFDKSTNKALLRFYPATVTYRRKLRLTDLDSLSGDQLRYVKAYVHWRLAVNELTVLSSLDLGTDNATINLDILKQFADDNKNLYTELKDEILLYATAS